MQAINSHSVAARKTAERLRPPSVAGVKPVVMRAGRPVIFSGGAAVPQSAYFDRIMRGDWEERVREFVESGVRVFHLTSPHGGNDFFDSAFWTDDGVYPVEDPSLFPYTLERQARFILSSQPEAQFYIGLGTSVPIKWTERWKSEMQTDEDGRTYREASLASDRYLRDLSVYLKHLVSYCETRPWSNRIVGYMVVPFGEGCLPLNIAGKMFDCSPAADRAFREWVRARYRTAERLRKTWGERSLKFEAVRVPRDSEWLRKRAEAVPFIGGRPLDAASIPNNGLARHRGLFHWVEPSQMAAEIDYARFMRDMSFRWLRTIARSIKAECSHRGRNRFVAVDAVKVPLMGWEILSAFDGIGDGHSFPSMLFLSGAWDVGPLLDEPCLDGFITPADYTARMVGCAYEAEGVTDSLLLRGKTMVLENDARTYVGAGIRDQGAFRTDEEVEAGLKRNAALTLSRGFQSYWCNVGSSYFHSPGIHRTIAKLVRTLDRLNEWPHRETVHAVAMVLDDTSFQFEDLTSGYQYLSVVWQRVIGLAHCGIPYRIFLLSDLERSNFPDYRVFLFPNLFRVDGRTLGLLRRKVFRDGRLAIFGPATGITDGRILGARGAGAVLGVEMELFPRQAARHVVVRHRGHPITAGMPANGIYGDSLVYGPVLAPAEGAVEKSGACALGDAILCWFINRPGLFIREFGRGCAGNGRPGRRRDGDYGVLWSCAMPLPSYLLRAAAGYAGCHVWCEEDDVVYASESVVAIHTAKAGRRVLKLPGPRDVRDAETGRLLARNSRLLRMTLKSPDTRIFAVGSKMASGRRLPVSICR